MSIAARIHNLLVADDAEHWDELRRTGFWGKRAAGCIFLARDSERLLIAHRSAGVEQPNSWGTWGGALDGDEKPLPAVKREILEETGYRGKLQLIPLYVFTKRLPDNQRFRYYNFLAVVPNEFTPKLDWETQGYVWVKFGEWPQPLHGGLIKLLQHQPSVNIIQREIASANK
jgi:8-oxo-dGTP pyrophosphatase MutT (NUDIX family)